MTVTSASAAYQTVDVPAAVVDQPTSVEPIEHLRAGVRGLLIDHFSLLGKPLDRDGILASHMQAECGTFFLHAGRWYCHVDYVAVVFKQS